MDNQDKLYQQFQNAAQNAPEKEFPAMEKIWGRVEEKLDKKALKKENNLWKKIAVAASILLFTTIGYQVSKNSDDNVIIPTENVVSTESQDVLKDSIAVTEVESKNSLLKDNAPEIIKAEVNRENKLAVQEMQANSDEATPTSSFTLEEKEITDKRSTGYFNTRKFDAIGVRHYEQEITPEKITEETTVTQEKAAPLLVIDGKAVKEKNQINYKEFDTESVQYLNNPLYIINGVEYTEKELFGPNPTSPYYPLNKQEITSTTILQGESATNLYGNKGKDGVVIISTKDKKPLKN